MLGLWPRLELGRPKLGYTTTSLMTGRGPGQCREEPYKQLHLNLRKTKTAVYACTYVSMHACIPAYIHHLLWCTDFPSNSTNILIVWTDYSAEHAFPRATLPPPQSSPLSPDQHTLLCSYVILNFLFE